ncbi:MAG TPA: Hachiman antiphage defense system protein HamA, partial [Candidatus Acidoferrum sp.]
MPAFTGRATVRDTLASYGSHQVENVVSLKQDDVPTQTHEFLPLLKDAVKSITEHILPDFITAEKAMITAHVDDKAPFFSDIKKILRQKTSADVLLKKAVFPVLIAYNSRACASHTDLTKEYVQELTRETKRLHDLFAKRA